MIRTRLFRAGEAPEPFAELAVADVAGRLAGARADDAHLLWVDVEQPMDAEIAALKAELRLAADALTLVVAPTRRPKVRVYPDAYVMTVLALDLHEHATRLPRIEVIEVDLLVGRNLLVTFHKRPLPFARDIAERTATNPQLGRFDAAYLLYVFLDELLDSYSQEFDELEGRLERFEERLLDDPSRAALRELLYMKRHIQNLRHLVAPHAEAFSSLTAPDTPISFTPGVDAAAFRDLTERLQSLVARLDHVRDLAASGQTTYMSAMSYRTNQQLKVLTFLSAMLLPMTVITGLFGTNFKLAEYDGWEPFYVMLVAMGAISAAMLLFFRTRRWL